MPPQGFRSRLARFWQKDIWQTTLRADRSPRGWLCAFLRVVSISCSTFNQTKTASRAADLSFSSMVGLGPLTAIVMLVVSTVFGQRNPNLAVDLLQRLISFVAPQLNQYDAQGAAGPVRVNPQLVDLINGFITGARSSTVGYVGALSLVLIVLFLFKSIEDVFNDIWGVRRGRTILMRFVFYWAMVALGGLLFFAAVTLVGAGEFMNVFVSRLPFGSAIGGVLHGSLPALSFALLVAVLASFYRAIPNTRVWWVAALSGAVVVALLLTANNYLQFLYLRRVLLTKSLFGSLGIIPVLMFGLYVFWLFVLIGGQISYAVQNVDVRESKLSWSHLSAANRERLSLAVLMAICRRSHSGRPPISAWELSATVRLPAQVLNECLNMIIDLGFVARVPAPPGSGSADACYSPARPLAEISLLQFKVAADNHGADPGGDSLGWSDPIVRSFGKALEGVGREAFFSRSVADLLGAEASGK
jgi:membrane protein